MALVIGHASQDERGKFSGGKAGDSTGKEVCTRSYYMHQKGWYALRPKSVTHANAIAKAMKQATSNNNIGYDQSGRLGIMSALKKYGSLEKIATKTECDCSSLIRACIYQATGVDVGNFNTGNEATVLVNSGLFQKKISVTSSTTLYNGDVLVTKTKAHTVAVVSGRARSSSSSSSTTTTTTTTSSKIDTIKEVQNWANKNYDSDLSVDGGYGDKTKKALVKILQKELNQTYGAKLSVDGVFGEKTKEACPTLKSGSKNDVVGVLQAFLICNGYTSAYLDKDYGDGTVSAVKSYQKKKGLTADGIAGKNTFAELCS
jgi:peptidoglycan hydrolase-like protein with peptidoglycan-binding domain